MRVTRIEPVRGWVSIDFDELLRYRDLLYFLTWRDVKVRYKQTFLGVAWALLVPLTQMLIFGVIFGKVAKLPSSGIDPFLFYLAALVPWQYFSNSLSQASVSLVNQSHSFTKVYFPRLFIPLSSCIASLVDFSIAFAMLVGVTIWLEILPPLSILVTPILLGIAICTSFGAGLVLCALNARYRDVKFVVPFLIQIWMFGSVLLPFSTIPAEWGSWRYVYGLNPMAGVIEGFRWCVLHRAMSDPQAPWALLAAGVPTALLLLLLGLYTFQRTERKFADVV